MMPKKKAAQDDLFYASFEEGTALGMSIKSNESSTLLSVTSVKPGGQAAEAGVTEGLFVAEINGEKVPIHLSKKALMQLFRDAHRPMRIGFALHEHKDIEDATLLGIQDAALIGITQHIPGKLLRGIRAPDSGFALKPRKVIPQVLNDENSTSL